MGSTSLAAVVGEDTSELDCPNLEPEDVTRGPAVRLSPGAKLPEVGDAVSAFLNRLVVMPGDFFDGTVLLLWTPPLEVVVVSGLPGAGEPGLGWLLDALEFFDDTETFLLMPPCFRRLSAPALAFEADLPRAA